MTEPNEGTRRDKDPMRLCYVCRMPISALAIRCRFCGAEVGRPRKEQETYTVEDLGGEKIGTYTLSSDVTDALEAFAMEEKAQLEAQERERLAASRKSFFRHGNSPTDSKHNLDMSLADLDARHIDVSKIDIFASRPKEAASPKKPLTETLGKRLVIVALFIAAIVILYFGTEYAWSWIRGKGTDSAATDAYYPNRADQILAQGGSLIEAHKEAMIALQHDNSGVNRRIAEEVRAKLIADIEERAYSKPFDMQKITGASSDSSAAAQIDSTSEITDLADRMNREVALFKFILTACDPDKGTASFRLNNPYVNEKEQELQTGGLLQERFLVKSISARGVSLEDTHPKAGGRLLLAKPMIPVMAD